MTRRGGRESRGERCDDWTRWILEFVLVEQRTRLEYAQVSQILAEGLHLVVGGHRILQVALVASTFALSQQGPGDLAQGRPVPLGLVSIRLLQRHVPRSVARHPALLSLSQLAAKTKLRQRGIMCDDATKALSILSSINNPMQNPTSRAKCAAAKIGASNANYEGDKWSPGEVIQLRELCKAQYSILKIAEIMKCDVASKRMVHNKILELHIQVKFKGKYQLLTEKYN